MADYVPIFDGDEVPLTAGAAVTGGQLVYLTAANTVSPAVGATDKWVGVALFDAAIGDRVTISTEGVHELTVSAAVAVGDVVIPAATGRVAPIGAGTNYAQQVGVALTAQPAAGQTCRVLIR